MTADPEFVVGEGGGREREVSKSRMLPAVRVDFFSQ